MAPQRSRLIGALFALVACFAAGSDPAAAGTEVRGQILGPSGDPLARAWVELLPVLPNYRAGCLTLDGVARPEPVAAIEADAGGRFLIQVAEVGLYALRAGAPGFVPASFQPLPVVESVELPVVRLQREAGIELAVKRPGGQPVAGAWVFAETEQEGFWQRLGKGWRPSFRKARTDEAGHAWLSRAEGETLRVSVFAAGVPTLSRTAVEADLALVLAAGDSRRIEVTDELGHPLSGVLVRTGPLAWPAGLTGPDGSLTVTATPDTPLLLLLADAAGRQRWLELPPAPNEPEPLRIAVAAPRVLAGQVLDADAGRSVSGALVWAPADPGTFRLSDRAGRFQLPVPPRDRLVVRAAGAGYLPGRARLGRADLARGQAPALELIPALRVTGRLVDPFGRAEPEAEIELSARRLASSGRHLRAKSAATGRFELGPVPAGDFRLLVRKAGRAPLTLRHRPREGQRTIDLGTLVLRAEAAVLGEVLDPAGRPVPGAEVRALAEAGRPGRSTGDPDAITDAGGRFRLGGRAAGETLTLLVRAAGFAPARLPGIEPPVDRPIAVVLEPGWSILGSAVDEEAHGIPGAEVHLAWRPAPGSDARELAPRRGYTLEALADENGRFELEGVVPGLATVEVTAAGFAPATPREVEISIVEKPGALIFVLPRGGRLAGRVATTDGQPLAGVRIGTDHADTVTDADGRYRLEGLPSGPVEVAAYRPDLGRRLRTVTVTAPSRVLNWTFAAGVEVSGRVVDGAGSPLAGAAVGLSPVSGPTGGHYRGESGPDGTFTLSSVARGHYELRAGKTGFAEGGPAPPQLVVVGEPVAGLEVVLVQAATVSGKILGLEVHQLAQVRVGAYGAEEQERSGWVDSTGDYEIGDLAPGEWSVTAALAGGRRLARARLSLPAGERAVRLDLEFAPGLELSGEVLRRGLPLAGARLSLVGPAPELRRTVGSSHHGEFRFADLEPGRYRLEITHAEALVVHNQSLELDRDVHLQLDLGSAVVRGRVIAAGSYEPLPAAVVTLLHRPSAPGEEEFLLSSGSNEAGLFEFLRVPPGRYRLVASMGGVESGQQEIVVSAGYDLMDLELTVGEPVLGKPLSP